MVIRCDWLLDGPLHGPLTGLPEKATFRDETSVAPVGAFLSLFLHRAPFRLPASTSRLLCELHEGAVL